MRIFYNAKGDADELLIHEFVLSDEDGNELVISADETEASTKKVDDFYFTEGRMKGVFLSDEDFSRGEYLNGQIGRLKKMNIVNAYVTLKDEGYEDYDIELLKVVIEDGTATGIESYTFRPEQLTTIHLC